MTRFKDFQIHAESGLEHQKPAVNRRITKYLNSKQVKVRYFDVSIILMFIAQIPLYKPGMHTFDFPKCVLLLCKLPKMSAQQNFNAYNAQVRIITPTFNYLKYGQIIMPTLSYFDTVKTQNYRR